MRKNVLISILAMTSASSMTAYANANLDNINTIKQVAVLTDDHGSNLTLHLPKHVLRTLIDTLNTQEADADGR